MLLGWFLLVSSRAEMQSTLMHDRLADVRIVDVMTPHPDCGPDYLDVQSFLERVVQPHSVSAFPLRDLDGRVTGLVTVRQLAGVPHARRSQVRVREVAFPRAAIAEAAPDDLLLDVLERPHPQGAGGRILVFEQGLLVGIVTASDIARLVQRAELLGRHPVGKG
jgi:CBS domain-containing protein